jgi:hypothetical protein
MGKHPLRHLLTAASGRDLSSAGDMAAALDWRLTALASTDPGPLPWLPGIPPTLRAHSAWATIWNFAVPPIHQASTGLTNDRLHAPHLVARTTTTGAHTRHSVSVERASRTRPAAQGAVVHPMQ